MSIHAALEPNSQKSVIRRRKPASAPAPDEDRQQKAPPLEALLFLEGEVRRAGTERDLWHLMANETRRLVDYERCSIFVAPVAGKRLRLKAASSLSRIDANAPAVRDLEAVMHDALTDGSRGALFALPDNPIAAACEGFDRPALIVPLTLPNGSAYGCLLLERKHAFVAAEMTLLARLADAYVFALAQQVGARRRIATAQRLKRIALGLSTMLAIALFMPVPFSAMAPAEVVARDPVVVSSPLDGVIESVDVKPNEAVAAGDILFRLHDTDLAGETAIAERAAEVAMARYRRVTQGASLSAEMRRDLAVLKAETELAISEAQTLKDRLDRTIIRASEAGIALFADAATLTGKPVATGERIMEIGDPNRVELRIELAVGDQHALVRDATVRLFPDGDPLNAVDATIERLPYRAEPTDDGHLAYHIVARFPDHEAAPAMRIGQRGTARLSDGKVMLGYYILRRPLSLMRQYTGLI